MPSIALVRISVSALVWFASRLSAWLLPQTDHECETQKQIEVSRRKDLLRAQFRLQEARARSSVRVKESQIMGEQRVRRLRHQDGLMTELAEDARESVSSFADPSSIEYKSLLPRLIGQAMAQIVGRGSKVTEVEVRVRASDVAALVDAGAGTDGGPLSASAKAMAVAEYEATVRRERAAALAARVEAETASSTSEAAAAAAAASASGTSAAAAEEPIEPLPEALVAVQDVRLEAEAGRIGGGVIISAAKGRILVDNSLNARVALATHELQHLLRAALFDTTA